MKQSEFSKTLSRLPQQPSPATLDQRLLAEAREEAQYLAAQSSERPLSPAPWMSLAMAVSVVCVSLLLVLRNPLPDRLIERGPKSESSQDMLLDERFSLPAAPSRSSADVATGQGIALEEIVVTAQKREKNLQGVPVAITAARPTAEESAMQPGREESMQKPKSQPQARQLQKSSPLQHKRLLQDIRPLDEPELLAAPLAPEPTAGDLERQKKVMIDLAKELEMLKILLQQEGRPAAERAYADLRRRCKQCALPEQLMTALEMLD